MPYFQANSISKVFFLRVRKEPYISTKASYYFQRGHLYKSFLYALFFPPLPSVCHNVPKWAAIMKALKMLVKDLGTLHHSMTFYSPLCY